MKQILALAYAAYAIHDPELPKEQKENERKLEVVGQVDYGTVFARGKCPEIQDMKDVDSQKLSGSWYL